MTEPKTTSKNVRCAVLQEEEWFKIELFLAPVPASRPRVTRWGTYYGKTYKAWRAEAEKHLLKSEKPLLSGPLAVNVWFICTRPKTTKRDFPRGDVDNYEKALYDAITKAGYWIDDDQIVSATVHKGFAVDGETPRCVIECWKT